MARYLVTGRAGSGKSSIAEELSRRKFHAIDTDKIAGLAHWEDLMTGQPAAISDYTNVDLAQFEWVWDGHKLRDILRQNSDIILCGSAHNDLAFAGKFDRIFALVVAPEVQANRLRSRTNSDYGKSELMIPTIIQEQRQHVIQALALGAIPIDANQPLLQVVDEIVSHLHVN